MRKIMIILLLVAVMLTAVSCGCEHKWEEANCTKAKTCSLCKETEGSPLGHSWLAATCTSPKTCENCKATEGKAKGHDWQEASCFMPEQCSLCHEVKGEALEHEWEEATTEAPKTCKNCQKTEGKKLDIDPRFTTESTKHLYGEWEGEYTVNSDMMGISDLVSDFEITCYLHIEFTRTGEYFFEMQVEDPDAFSAKMKEIAENSIKEQLLAQGMDPKEMDQIFLQSTGMTFEEYVDWFIGDFDINEMLDDLATDSKSVYYVGQNGLYTAETWNDQFECSIYTLEDGVLTLEPYEEIEYVDEPMILTKVEEEN